MTRRPARASRRHRRWRTRLLGSAFGGVAAAVALTGVPGAGAASAPSAAALDQVQRATGATLASTAAVTLRMAGASSLGPASSVARGSGAFDFGRLTGTVTLATAGVKEPVVFTANQVYMRPPASAASLLPPTKPWLVADFTNPESVATNFPQFLLQIESVDPAFTLSEVLWGAVAATDQGPATVGGVATHRYRVTVDLHQASGRASGPGQTPFTYAISSELTYASSGSASSTLPVTVWIDGQGHVVQVADSPPGAGVGTTTLGLRAFGRPVAVTPPAGDRSLDIGELSPAAERELNGGGDSDGA